MSPYITICHSPYITHHTSPYIITSCPLPSSFQLDLAYPNPYGPKTMPHPWWRPRDISRIPRKIPR